MFTGLIADLGTVLALERDGGGAVLRVRTALAAELRVGDSIAVNGVCLTATRVNGGEGGAAGASLGEGAAGAAAGEFEAQAIRETLERSTLGGLAPGDPVNLELALRVDGRLGGHVVQGHVDGVGTVAEVREEGYRSRGTRAFGAGRFGDASGASVSPIGPRFGQRVVGVDADSALLPYVVEKGSIAIDGVSLTVSALREGGFEVSLIPETLARTTLGRAEVGRAVNLEADILAKHVQRLMEAHT